MISTLWPAAEALAHESPDVQARALMIIERWPDSVSDEVAAALAAAEPTVAPSLRPRVAALPGVAPQHDSGLHELPTPSRNRTRWPDAIVDATILDSLETVAPIRTPDELALAVARVLEHPEEIDELERALDGISRLCTVSRLEPAAMWVPLRKRAQRHLDRGTSFDGRGVATDFAAVVAAWLDQQPPAPSGPAPTVMGFFSARLHAVAARAAAGLERPLLSAPTHRGGWIDPETLVARLTADTEVPNQADLVLARLRLAPNRRDEALAAAAALIVRQLRPSDSRWVASANHRHPSTRCGSPRSERGSPVRTPPIWAAVSGSWVPVRPRSRGPSFGWSARAGSTSSTTWLSRPSPKVDRPRFSTRRCSCTHAPTGAPGDLSGTGGAPTKAARAGSEADVRWAATLQPSDLEPFFTEGLARIGNNLDWWEARWELRAFLEPLLELRTSLSSVAVRLLALALAAKEPGIRTLATDATVATLLDGRLPPSALGASLADAWASAFVTPRRFALSLAAVAATSTKNRGLVREAMTLGLRSAPRADASQVLELLHELCHADGIGVTDPGARASLAAYRSGKAGRIAENLLAIRSG